MCSFGTFVSPLRADLQFGPFLDAKHEQVEVSGWGWSQGETGYSHSVKASLLLSSLGVYPASVKA